MPTIADATVLSHFAVVDRLDLLRELFPTLYVAQAVFDEIRRGVEQGFGFLHRVEEQLVGSVSQGFLQLVAVESETELQLFEQMPSTLQRGEAMSLAIASQRGWSFLTDDRDARRAAERLSVAVGGTLGILVRHVRLGSLTLDEGNALLRAMIDRGRYRSPVDDLRLLDLLD